MKYVLIGAGPAGVQAAEVIRHEDRAGEITLISGEPGEPYSRMAIPYILSGLIDERGARSRKTAGHFANLGIRYLNNKAVKVHAGATGGTVDLDDGTTLAYDRLLRKVCALAMLKRLVALQNNPTWTKAVTAKISQISDNAQWFKGYRKDAMSAVGQ